MKYQNGLRVYAVVKFNDYPEWNILITGFEEYQEGESVTGFAFNNKGEFETGVNLSLPLEYKEVGYVDSYKKNKSILKLTIKEINVINKKDLTLVKFFTDVEDICYTERNDRDVGIDIRGLLEQYNSNRI